MARENTPLGLSAFCFGTTRLHHAKRKGEKFNTLKWEKIKGRKTTILISGEFLIFSKILMRVARFGLTPVSEVRADKENKKNKEKKREREVSVSWDFRKKKKKNRGKKN